MTQNYKDSIHHYATELNCLFHFIEALRSIRVRKSLDHFEDGIFYHRENAIDFLNRI